ncbi:MAG: hypothetical protein HZA16_09015 [Nitrospirae bacterium]|nr:hypothetical protein [Nitrospirota bacterium]
MKNIRLILCAGTLLFFAHACTESKGKQEGPVFRQVPEIAAVKPEKPLKIKLKRNAKDDYSWEISGDSVDEIVRADEKLRKGLRAP